ncbi:hypothetical protein [Flavobacterium cellulosilyticum]|uniref:Uncharacterized protein n=1 Tax=Flavobacterium cellulosilyticum TaxID=2541731 RepID=A0A4V2YYQ4_9FLAO|nr:hypothetical protein [Flavobacterium cellulosilyticum]TDD94127.1 hypothetical protein E0F76_17705 [Flavobacterium cellulosilyticum]
MAKYGNILTLFNTEANENKKIDTILTKNQTTFLNLNNTYYIETNSKKNTSEVINDINALGIKYIFFHNHISDGSLIKNNGIDEDKISKINTILFK